MHRSKAYLKFLRTQPCVACRQMPIERVIDVVPAHKGGGMGIKGHDKEALPLCVSCHSEEHRGQRTFWEDKDRDFLVRQHWDSYIKRPVKIPSR